MFKYVFCLVFFASSISFAQDEPKMTYLKKGSVTPYDGALLNDVAQAQIISEKKNVENNCQLQNSYLVNREVAKCDLLIGNSKLDLSYTQKKYDTLLDAKNKELDRMTKLAEKGTKDYSMWWAAGGMVVGIAATVAVFFLVTSASK
jgi:hypothetical protein